MLYWPKATLHQCCGLWQGACAHTHTQIVLGYQLPHCTRSVASREKTAFTFCPLFFPQCWLWNYYSVFEGLHCFYSVIGCLCPSYSVLMMYMYIIYIGALYTCLVCFWDYQTCSGVLAVARYLRRFGCWGAFNDSLVVEYYYTCSVIGWTSLFSGLMMWICIRGLVFAWFGSGFLVCVCAEVLAVVWYARSRRFLHDLEVLCLMTAGSVHVKWETCADLLHLTSHLVRISSLEVLHSHICTKQE